MRKGYNYDKIKSKLEESGISMNKKKMSEMSEQELRHEIQLFKEKCVKQR